MTCKIRYANDPEYRELVKRQARESYKRNPNRAADRRARLLSLGKCPQHPNREIVEGRKHCDICLPKAADRQRQRVERLRAIGKCPYHMDVDVIPGVRRCHKCKEKATARNNILRDKKAKEGKCRCGNPLVSWTRWCEPCLWRPITRRTGWTKEAYSAAYEKQRGRCALCERSGQKIVSGHSKKSECLVGDHDHKADRPRGLLCHWCNTAVGLLEENITRIKLFARRISGYLSVPDDSESQIETLPLFKIVS